MKNMREILFRGFREYENGKQKVSVNGEWHKGEWVYGYPVIDTGDCSLKAEGKCLCPHDGTSIFFWNDNFHEYTDCEIIPSTVGQYTGLTDKNGTKIFEGDIIAYADYDEYQRYIECRKYPEQYEDEDFSNIMWTTDKVVYGIETGYPAFDLNSHIFESNGLSELSESGRFFYEVVGNIHDNPDLLKGEAE